MSTTLRAASGSSAENLFISLFEDVFGAEKTGYLYSQYPFFDIYQDSRFADYLPTQRGRTFQLKEHQQEALDALAKISKGVLIK